jgi:hypothetical protein
MMITQPTRHNSTIYPPTQSTLARLQARRRRRLGVLLIVAGSIWLVLSLAGHLGDAPRPIDYVSRSVAALTHIIADDLLAAPLAVCGMLAAATFLRRR